MAISFVGKIFHLSNVCVVLKTLFDFEIAANGCMIVMHGVWTATSGIKTQIFSEF